MRVLLKFDVCQNHNIFLGLADCQTTPSRIQEELVEGDIRKNRQAREKTREYNGASRYIDIHNEWWM